ncbi:MAG: EAL domain-containing protein, partial [Pseudomonadales bacterium]
MILCGSIANFELRQRLTRLADGVGWNTWITHQSSFLKPMLEASSPPPDAIISDDRQLLVNLSSPGMARILLADYSAEDAALFIVSTRDDDQTLIQHIHDCINAARLKSRFTETDKNEPITRLPRHQELVNNLARHRGQAVALLVVQVDHAEHLYANLDPVSRTDLLHALATRLKLAVPADGMIGFYDAGCFIVGLPTQPVESLMGIADDIRSAVKSPLIYSGGEIHLTVSIGCNHVARYDQFDFLWQGAWQAVNRATTDGGNRIEGGPSENISTRLPNALEREEFGLVLQGQWSDDRLTGAEALLRWQGLEVGELAPSHFIPIAEQQGFITRIGDWVLEQASSAAASWLEHLIQPLLLGVNISPQQFVNGAITRQIDRLRRENWLDPAMLELELSQENMLLLVDEFREQLYQLRDWGVRFAIDNLGKELIDSDKLLRCPADTLKIDRSLIAKIDTHPASRDLIREIWAIGDRFH